MSVFEQVGRDRWARHSRPLAACDPNGAPSGRVPSPASRLRHAWSFLWAPLFVFVCLAPLRAETILSVPTAPESGATIRFIVPWAQTPRFGFAPVRVSIENRANGERTWQVQFGSGVRGISAGVLNTTQSISVPGGQTRDVWILVPVAEPGVSIGGMGMPFTPSVVPPAPVVKITPTPNGKKVSTTHAYPGGGSFVREDEIDTKTATITSTTTTTTSGGSTTTPNSPRSIILKPGIIVTYTIDRTTGGTSVRTRLNVTSNAPAVVSIEEGNVPPPRTSLGVRPAAGTVVPISAPLALMMLSAEVSGPGVSSGRTMFPGSSSTNGMRPVAVSAVLEPVLRGKLSTLVSGAPNLSTVDVSQLPADWRVWSSFSAVLLTAQEYAGLDSARRAALRSWVALGGQLCLTPAAEPGGGQGGTEKLGAGIIVTLSEPLGAATTEQVLSGTLQAELAARRMARATGSARIPGSTATPEPPAASAAAPTALLKEVQFFAGTAGLPDRSALTLENGPLFDAVNESPADIAWLAVFLVAFAVVVGPVNLFLFAPAQKRYRLFVTTPLIALAASLLLGVTILVQDGLGGAGAQRAFVVLLPGENEAAVFQEQAAHTGFLTGRSFALPDDVAMAVMPLEKTIPFVGPNVNFVRGNGRADGDWFQSRSRQAQHLRRIVPTRARIEAVGVAPDGAPIIQSSLGTTLREFSFVDVAGKGWRAAEVPSGQRVTLQSGITQWASGAAPTGSPNFRVIVAAAGAMGPGRWSALGGATELAPILTLGSIRWANADVLYTGAVENAAAVLPPKNSASDGGVL